MEHPLTELFWENVPRAYLARLFRGMHQAYSDAHEEVFRRREYWEAINLEPLERRANVQQLMRDVATFFPNQVNADPTRGECQSNWWYYTKVVCGSVILTSNSAPHPDHVLRYSEARNQYSRHTHRQRELFEKNDAKAAEDNDCNLFGILLHGSGPSKAELAFAVVRFPLANLGGYYQEQIDLFREFPDIADGFSPTAPTGDDYGDGGIELREQDGKA